MSHRYAILRSRSARGVVALALLAFTAVGATAGKYGPVLDHPRIAPPTLRMPWLKAITTELVSDGSFEAGGVGWFVANAGDGFWFAGSSANGPISGLPLAAPVDGANQAFTDQGGPGEHILYQDVAIPASSTAVLNLVFWYENYAGAFYNPSPQSLDYTLSPNQQFRIDIMNPLAPVDDVGAGVLVNLYQTKPGDPTSLGYTTITANLTAYAGQTIRLRFSETDNQLYFNVGVDAVSIQSDTVVPTSNATWGEVKGRYR